MPSIASIEYFRVPPRWLFIKLVDEHGQSGWGEATLEGHTEAVEGYLEEVKERLVGTEANEIEHIWQQTWRVNFYRGGPVFMSVAGGIDIALWDLKARRLGVPIYELLGGKLRDKIQVYCSICGDQPGDDVESQAKARFEQGFRTIKMKPTSSIGWLDSPSVLDMCVERVKAVKELGMDIALDFHGRLHKPMAKQLAKLLEPHRPLFIEEPLLSEQYEGVAKLSELTSIPIALGERLYSRWMVKPFLEAGSVDVMQPDVVHIGGISEFRRVAAMCEAYDVAIAPHCPLGPIALAASVQVAASIPNFTILEMSLDLHTQPSSPDISSYVRDGNVWKAEAGFIKLMRGPGLGIEIDEDQVRRLSHDEKPWRSVHASGPGGEIREW